MHIEKLHSIHLHVLSTRGSLRTWISAHAGMTSTNWILRIPVKWSAKHKVTSYNTWNNYSDLQREEQKNFFCTSCLHGTYTCTTKWESPRLRSTAKTNTESNQSGTCSWLTEIDLLAPGWQARVELARVKYFFEKAEPNACHVHSMTTFDSTFTRATNFNKT